MRKPLDYRCTASNSETQWNSFLRPLAFATPGTVALRIAAIAAVIVTFAVTVVATLDDSFINIIWLLLRLPLPPPLLLRLSPVMVIVNVIDTPILSLLHAMPNEIFKSDGASRMIELAAVKNRTEG